MAIYNLKEQHDSYVWDYVRKEFENKGTKNFNIGDGKEGHVHKIYIRCCLRPHKRS